MEYTTDQKLAGQDLHGLPCRIPEPTAEQAKCPHSKRAWVHAGDGDFDDNGVWVHKTSFVSVTTFEDIPNTNNLRCTLCGYTRRY